VIFLNCINEELIQAADKTRIDVSKTFYNGLAPTNILVKPEGTEDFISVFNADQSKWYLDWSYATDGEKTISVQATDGVDTFDKTFTIQVIAEEDDQLYSNDSQIFTLESELKKYIVPGRNSYKNIHREAQRRILDFLDRKRIWNVDGTRLTKDQLNVDKDLERWSLYEALVLIYEDLVVSGGDKFKEKASEYTKQRNYMREAGAIRIDRNKDGEIEPNEGELQELKSYRLIKR
jgi:hypothetical protein